jgi:ribosomal protein S18 acetylase RimI-like enzyme
MWTRETFRGGPVEWDALCATFGDFTPTQTHAWGEARAEEGWTLARDAWRDESGEVVAAATVLGRRRFGFRVRYISRGPLVRREGLGPDEVGRRFRLCIEAYRRILGWGEVLVCAVYPPLTEIGPDVLSEAGLRPLFVTSAPHAVSSTLALTDSEVLPRSASSDWRNRFRKSQAMLSEVKSSSDAADFLAARQIVGSLEKRKGFSTTITSSLLRGLAASGSRLFYIENAERSMTAAVLLATAGPRVFRLMAGVAPDENRRNPGAGRVLEVAAVRWAFEAGFREYDLEGLDPQNRGVWDFKLGMRGRLFAGAGLHAVSRPRFIAAAFSYRARRAWRTPLLLWRSSPAYFVRTVVRRASGGRLDARRMTLYRRELGSNPAGENRPGFTVLALERFDPDAFRYQLSTARELWTRTRDLRRGALECCVQLGPDGFATGYGFLNWTTASLPEIGETIRLDPDEAYISDCVILPEFRGRGLYPYLLNQICGHAKRRGVSRVRIAVDAGNVPSVRGIEGAGFEKEREAVYRRTWGRRELRWNPTTN